MIGGVVQKQIRKVNVHVAVVDLDLEHGRSKRLSPDVDLELMVHTNFGNSFCCVRFVCFICINFIGTIRKKGQTSLICRNHIRVGINYTISSTCTGFEIESKAIII